MSFTFIKLQIPDIILVKPDVFCDERGVFFEFFKKSEFEKAGIKTDFLQDNHSVSNKGVLRGLHYQKRPMAQGKLIRCIKGNIFDVAVDIRLGSATFGRYVFAELSEDNKHMLWIPDGFAHAFLALSENTEIIYKVSGAEYSHQHDAGIIWNDEVINIEWPLNKYQKPILSEKDKRFPSLNSLTNEELL